MALLVGACAPGSSPSAPVPVPTRTPTAVSPAAVSPTAASASSAPTASATGPIVVNLAVLGARLPVGLSRAVAFADGASILVAGGLTAAGTTDGVLQITLPDGPIASVGRLAAPVHDAGGALLAGRPVVVGGGDAVPEVTVQGLDGVLGSLPRARADLVAVAVDGMLVAVGGGTAAGPDSAVLATTDGVTWRPLGTLKVGVRYPAVGVVDGLIIVVGGTSAGVDRAAIQAIDPVSGAVRLIGSLPRPLSHASALVLEGHLLILGGQRGGTPLDTIEEIDPLTGTVTAKGHLPSALSDAAAVVVGSVGYVIGGESPGLLRSLIEVDVSPAP